MTDPVATVRAAYDRIGATYHAFSHEAPLRVEFVHLLRDRLAPGSTVLELGCGPGDPATRLLAERHRVVAVDVSWTQLGIARGHAPAAALAQADVTRLAVRPGSVDAVTSFYVLGHLPAAAHAPLLRSFGAWLRPGGVLVTNAPMTPAESVDEWLGQPMFFGGIGPDATVTALEAGGLVVERAEPITEVEREDETATFLWVVAHKPS